MGNKNNTIRDKIRDKILNKEVPDSEIIQTIEYYPNFDINWCDKDWTLLIWAIIRNREKIVEYLLTNPNIKVNQKSLTNVDNVALHSVCGSGNIPILKLLLGHKDIDVNIRDNHGWTVLHFACGNSNCFEFVKELLLDARVGILINNDWGNTAWNIAINWGHFRIANIIKKTGYTSLLRISNGSLLHDIVRMIIEEYT